jgi:hypothetical protein
VGRSRCGGMIDSDGSIVCKSWIPALEHWAERPVEGARASLQEKMRATWCPLHLLPLCEALADDSIYRALRSSHSNPATLRICTIVHKNGGPSETGSRFSDLSSGCASSFDVQDVITRTLRLGGGVDDQLAVASEITQPRGEVRGRVIDSAVLDTSNSAQIGGCHLRNYFFDGICRGSERRCFLDRFAI